MKKICNLDIALKSIKERNLKISYGILLNSIIMLFITMQGMHCISKIIIISLMLALSSLNIYKLLKFRKNELENLKGQDFIMIKNLDADYNTKMKNLYIFISNFIKKDIRLRKYNLKFIPKSYSGYASVSLVNNTIILKYHKSLLDLNTNVAKGILLHELGHVKNKDSKLYNNSKHILKIVRRLTSLTILLFNPLSLKVYSLFNITLSSNTLIIIIFIIQLFLLKKIELKLNTNRLSELRSDLYSDRYIPDVLLETFYKENQPKSLTHPTHMQRKEFLENYSYFEYKYDYKELKKYYS